MKKHVLLVDHHSDMVRLFANAFVPNETGYKCTCAQDIDHARELIEYLHPDVIFIQLEPDIMEPLELVRHLKRNPQYKSTKIAVYASSMPYYELIAKGYGADYCMTPPQGENDIFQTLALLMNGSAKVR